MRSAIKQGKVVIPAEALSKAGIAPGSLVVLRVEGGRIVVRGVPLAEAKQVSGKQR